MLKASGRNLDPHERRQVRDLELLLLHGYLRAPSQRIMSEHRVSAR